MRHAVLSLVYLIAALAAPVRAFEIETEARFAGPAATTELHILSTADIDQFLPIIEDFIAENPQVAVSYVVATSQEVMKGATEENTGFDLAISSAMDLQTKLTNDGYGQPYTSPATVRVPDWGKWRNTVYAFTQEPAAILISPPAFDGLPVPQTRQELIDVLRDNAERFDGRVGTYDIRDSGLGYLFATQDSRTSETFWRLSEVMGSLNARLYCCSARMIGDIRSGRLAVAYNVLASYVPKDDPAVGVILPQDYTTVMLRTAVILRESPNPPLARAFLDHLLRAAWSDAPFPFPTGPAVDEPAEALRPIRLGPGLLVYLDRLKRARFLQEWQDAVVQ